MRKIGKIALGTVAAFVLMGACGTMMEDDTTEPTSVAAGESAEAPEPATEEPATEEPTEATEAEKEAAEKAYEEAVEKTEEMGLGWTVAQENAVESAQSYVDMTGISKQGLIDQLSSEYGEGFTVKQARFAAKHVDANWKAEAVESAESYLEMTGMSRQGLIDQLTSAYGEQFTHAQAVYAANQVGL